MRRATLCLAAAAAVAAAIPGALAAQGFQVNEHGTCVMGRAGTGVASPCNDASAIFYNPAGMAVQNAGWTIAAGVTVIAAIGNFEADWSGQETKLANNPIPVPHLYGQYSTGKWAAGLGVFVPYGLGTVWPDSFEGRFNGWDNDLRSIYIQPSAAYKINEWVSVGAGVDIVVGSLELIQRVDMTTVPIDGVDPSNGLFGQLGIPYHTDIANAEIKGSGATGIGGNIGIWLRPTPKLEIGARYLSRVTLDYEGTADFEQVLNGIILPPQNPIALQNPGIPNDQPLPLDAVVAGAGLFDPGAPLSDQTVTTSITMPDQITVGLAFAVSPTLKLLGEYQWVHWSLFETLVADFEFAPDLVLEENYKNTSGFRFGLDWMASEKINVRGGYLHHQGAAPNETVTPLLPEGDRNEFTACLGIRLGRNWMVDLAYQYINQDQRRGRVRDAFPGTSPTVELNSGVYTFNAHLLGATVAVNF